MLQCPAWQPLATRHYWVPETRLLQTETQCKHNTHAGLEVRRRTHILHWPTWKREHAGLWSSTPHVLLKLTVYLFRFTSFNVAAGRLGIVHVAPVRGSHVLFLLDGAVLTPCPAQLWVVRESLWSSRCETAGLEEGVACPEQPDSWLQP